MLVYGDELMKHHLSDQHPLQPIRVKLTMDLINSTGLIEHCHLLPPRRATIKELELVHSPDYVDLVRKLSDPARAQEDRAGQDRSRRLRVRRQPHLRRASRRRRARGRRKPGRGARRSRAAPRCTHSVPRAACTTRIAHEPAGFCTYDDPAIAIQWLKDQGHRVAYVDVDVHHGDGVEGIFYDDPDVLTISLHESGRYLFPGTGFPEDAGVGKGEGAAANLPFEPFTWDEPWLEAFEKVVPPLLRRFKPTVLVTQDGCDTHYLDPLAHLAATTRIWPQVGGRFHELAHELCDGRWLALGGGGYAIYEVVPRAWTLFFAEMVERPDLAADLNDPAGVIPTGGCPGARLGGSCARTSESLARCTGSTSARAT